MSKDSIEKMEVDVQNVAIEIKKASEKSVNNSGISLKELIFKQLMEGKDKLASFKNSDNKEIGHAITLKDAVVSGRSDISGDTMAHRVAGVGQIQRRQPFLRSLFASGAVSANNHGVIRYTDQNSITSGAKTIAEKAAFPNTSAITWIERNLPVEKIGDSIKISREMMDDVDYVMSEIQNFLIRNIDLAIDTQLLSGDGNTPNLIGLATKATAFTADASFTNSVQDASYFDLIAVVAAQIMYGTSYMPNGILMNPYDVVKMKLKKNATDDYVIPSFIVPTANGNLAVDGMRVIANSGVAVNTMYVGDFSRGTVYSSDSMLLEFGYENDDFSKDLVTLKGRERLALLIRNVDAGAFNYVASISNSINSIKLL